MIDGIVNTEFDQKTNRRPRSKIYTQHLDYGKKAGWAIAGIAVVTGHIFVASVPLVSKGYNYIKDKVNEVKQNN